MPNEAELKRISSVLQALIGKLTAENSEDVDVSANDFVRSDGFFLYVGVSGVVHFDDATGRENSRTLVTGYHPIRMTKVYNASTTATNLAAIW